MSLLTHLLASDARRFRLAVALWLAVAGASAATAYAMPRLAWDSRNAEAIALASTLLGLAGALLSCALIPLVVQTHPAVGTDAFWMTRPVPAGTLVLSKVALVGVLFLGVPVAFAVPLMIAHRVPAAEVALVSTQTLLLRGMLLAALMAVAALTPTLARFAVVCGAVLLAAALLPPLLITASMWMDRERTQTFVAIMSVSGEVRTPTPPVDDVSGAIAAALALVAGGIACAAAQYATRRLRYSIGAAACGVVLAVVVGYAWPWRLLAQTSVVPEWTASPSALQLTADRTTVRFETQSAWQDAIPRRSVRARVRLTRAEPGWFATVGITRATLDLADGVRLTSPARSYPAAVPDDTNEPPWPAAVRPVLGVQRLPGDTRVADLHSDIVLQIPASELARASSRTGTYRGEFAIHLTRLQTAATLPLQRGAVFQDGAYRIAVDEVRHLEPGVSIRARESNAATMFDRRARPVYSYFLRNASRGEAVSGAAHIAREQMVYPLLGLSFYAGGNGSSGFQTNAQVINFDPRPYATGQVVPIVLDPQWLAGAELVILKATHDGSVRRTLEIPDFPLTEARLGS